MAQEAPVANLGMNYNSASQWASALALGVPAVAGGFGAWRANYENRKLAREQMAFQERMSSSAYQRAVNDARAAGLNPALMYQQGGASSPGGASADMGNVLGAGVSAFQDARRLREEIESMRTQRRLTDEQRMTQLDQQEYLKAQTSATKITAALDAAGLPAAQNRARVESSALGRGLSWVDRVLGSISAPIAGATGFGLGRGLNSARALGLQRGRPQFGRSPGQADVTPQAFDQPWLNRR